MKKTKKFYDNSVSNLSKIINLILEKIHSLESSKINKINFYDQLNNYKKTADQNLNRSSFQI